VSEVKVTNERVATILELSEIEVSKMGSKTTVVVVTLPSGFVIVESSSCVDPENYDEHVGKTICMERVENKIWELEGYVLQCAQAIQSACVVSGGVDIKTPVGEEKVGTGSETVDEPPHTDADIPADIDVPFEGAVEQEDDGAIDTLPDPAGVPADTDAEEAAAEEVPDANVNECAPEGNNSGPEAGPPPPEENVIER
jgi:hypothetical protein